MRKMKVLLKILLDNTDKYYDTKMSMGGLCFVCVDLKYDSVITEKEYHALTEFLEAEAIKSEYYKNTGIGYLFSPEDKESRKEWLEKQIKINI